MQSRRHWCIRVGVLLFVLESWSFAAERFVDNKNGTVTDTKTGLMWAAKDNNSNITWDNAKRYSENYRGGGYSDWRMPTLAELPSLYDGYSGGRISACAPTAGVIFVVKEIDLSCYSVWADQKDQPSGATTVSFFGSPQEFGKTFKYR